MEERCVRASASEPGSDGGLTVAEDPFSGGWVQPFCERREHHGDLLRGSFQTVQGGVASSTERGAASLTTERLDLLGLTMLAIANQRMNVSVCNPEVETLVVGTGIALGVHALGGSPPAFDLAPGTHRSRHWLSTRRGSGGETT